MKKSCKFEQKVVEAQKDGLLSPELKAHLQSCRYCLQSLRMVEMMQRVRKNTELSPLFQNKILPDPKIILNLADPRLVSHREHTRQIINLLRIPRIIGVFLSLASLAYFLLAGDVFERISGLIETTGLARINSDVFGFFLAILILPVMILLLFSIISGVLSRRERIRKLKLN